MPRRKLDRNPGVRLMIIGSEDDDRVFMKNVEALGATFVVDEHCTGSRYIWDDVIPHEDRLFAIASRYVKRVPCPSKDWPEFTRVNQAVKIAMQHFSWQNTEPSSSVRNSSTPTLTGLPQMKHGG